MTPDFKLLSVVGALVVSPAAESFMTWLGEPDALTPIADYEVLEFRARGVEMYVDEAGRISSISLYGRADGEHTAYVGTLPYELNFEECFAIAEEKIRSQSPISSVGNGVAWRRFDFSEYSIHLERDEQIDAVVTVTLISARMIAENASSTEAREEESYD